MNEIFCAIIQFQNISFKNNLSTSMENINFLKNVSFFVLNYELRFYSNDIPIKVYFFPNIFEHFTYL